MRRLGIFAMILAVTAVATGPPEAQATCDRLTAANTLITQQIITVDDTTPAQQMVAPETVALVITESRQLSVPATIEIGKMPTAVLVHRQLMKKKADVPEYPLLCFTQVDGHFWALDYIGQYKTTRMQRSQAKIEITGITGRTQQTTTAKRHYLIV